MRLQLAAETNSRLDAERELKKMKGETEPTRRSNRAKRGALKEVEVAPTAPSNVPAEPVEAVKDAEGQKENAGAKAKPVRRSVRQQKAAGAAQAAVAGGEENPECKQQ